MLTVEQLKPFLLHEHARVRERVSRYFKNGHIQDLEIVPRVLEACHRYGFVENRRLLIDVEGQPVTPDSFLGLLQAYQDAEDPQVAYRLGRLMLYAPHTCWEAHAKDFRGKLNIEDSFLRLVELRHSLAVRPAEELWMNLQNYAKQSDVDKCSSSAIEHDYVNFVVRLLGQEKSPHAETLCEMLASKAIEGTWLEIFLIDLIGARRLAVAVDLLEQRLGMDDDYLPPCCAQALVRIGDPHAIHLIRDNLPNKSWDYQLYASDVLGSLKHPDSEKALLSLRFHPGVKEDIRPHLAIGLFDLFSTQALDWGYELLDDPSTNEIDNIREMLFATATVNNLHLTDMETWAEELRQPQPWIREDSCSNELPLDRLRPEPPIDIEDIAPVPHTPTRDSTPATVRRENPKVGRNEPCPCGSGRKLKKCCGA